MVYIIIALKMLMLFVFGKSLNEITNRVTFKNVSILTRFQKVIEIFDLYYVIEKIDGFERKRKK